MIGEVAAIISSVNVAVSGIKRMAETSDDLSSIASFIAQIGGAEVELGKAQNSGKLSEADAIKAALCKKQLSDQMAEIKQLFLVSGNGHLWAETMQALADARVAKQKEIAQIAAKKKKYWSDVREVLIVFGLVLVLTPTLVWFMIYSLTH